MRVISQDEEMEPDEIVFDEIYFQLVGRKDEKVEKTDATIMEMICYIRGK